MSPSALSQSSEPETALPTGAHLKTFLFRSLPSLSAAFLADRFLVPWTRIPGLDRKAPLENISSDGHAALLKVRGKGPLVVLAHGWSGSGRQFALLNAALVDAGFRTAAFDAPAHGSAPGRSTNAHEFARLIGAIGERHGPIAGIVGHSLGGLASAMAAEWLNPRALALLAPMPSFDFALDSYQAAVGFDDAIKERIALMVERRARTTRAQSRIERGLSDRRVLVIHDQGDRRIPVQASRDLLAHNPGLEYWETTGLGHSRLLVDGAVRNRVVQFMLKAARADP